MYSREQLQGILLTVARPEVTIYQSDRSKTGHTVRLRVMFRAKEEFLQSLRRTFEQYNIDCILRDSEGVNRDKPVLIVGKRNSINNLINLMPVNVPCSHASWETFGQVLQALEEDEHLETEGMTRLITLVKGNE